MIEKKINRPKTKLIILMASVMCALFQSAAPANNVNNFGSQDPSQLHFYYHDTGHPQIPGVRVQPGEVHPRNLQSVYSCHEQVNFARMSKSEFGDMFQDVANENAILNNYEMYAFEGFKGYARGLMSYKKFILSLKDKIQNDKEFREQTKNIPGFKYSFFLWREKSGFHDFINEEARIIGDQEARRIKGQENFARSTDVQELLKELKNDNSEYKPVPWAVGHEDRHKKRLHALEQINSCKGVWTTKKYSVPDSLELLQKDFEPKISSLKEFYGNQFQHVLHDEFIDILKKSELIYTLRSAHVFDKELTQAVVHFVGVGVEHNMLGHSQKAMSISDFGHAAIEYLKAFELGFLDGVEKKISELSSPVEYVKNLAVGMLTMAGYLIKVLADTQLPVFLTSSYAESLQLQQLSAAQQTAQLIKIAETYYKNNSGQTMVQQGAELLTDVALDIYLSGKILNAFAKLGKIGLAQRAETVPLVKELRPRRPASFHPAQSDELVISAEKAAKILVDNKPYSPAAEVIELTSQALIENSCNIELVVQPKQKLALLRDQKTIANTSYDVSSILKTIGNGVWKSPQGLVYEKGSKQGNRIKHILEHAKPNPRKPVHSIFNMSENQILDIIDEAWTMRKNINPVNQTNGNTIYSIPMGRIIGTKNETKIRIVVQSGTSNIVTAFPVQ